MQHVTVALVVGIKRAEVHESCRLPRRRSIVQVEVGMAMDLDGRSIRCEMWPGSTPDVTTPCADRQANVAALRAHIATLK